MVIYSYVRIIPCSVVHNVYTTVHEWRIHSFEFVLSGLPQGSFSGPFLLLINDITDLFTGAVNIKLFAVDIEIYLEITNNSDLPSFQKSIDEVENWASTWQLKLAVNKCQPIHISLSRSTVLIHFSLQNNLLYWFI